MTGRSRTVVVGLFSLLLHAFAVPAFAADDTEARAEERTALDVVRVTAQKRSEEVNAVPMSLEVVTPRDLKASHTMRIEDVAAETPNVMFSTGQMGGALSPTFSIRGVGSTETETDPSIGVFVDGVPLTQVHGYLNNLLDVEQVEILRGPQGTLYGRNTLGGAINITSRKANPGKQEAYITVGGGSHEQFRTELMANIPLWDGKAAVRAAFGYSQQGHVWDNRYGGNLGKQNNYQGRLSWFMELGENTTVDFSADMQKQYRNDSARMTLTDYEDGDRTFKWDAPSGGEITSGGVRLEINHDFADGHKLTSLSAYRSTAMDYTQAVGPEGYFENTNMFHNVWLGFTNFRSRDSGEFTESFGQISQELRLTSPDDQDFKYVIGVYADYNRADRLNGATNRWDMGSLRLPSTLADDHGSVKLRSQQDAWSVAVFGNASYDFNEHWQVFGGLRVGYDKKNFDFSLTSNLGDAFISEYLEPVLGGGIAIRSYDGEWSKVYWMPRGGIKYSFNENNNIYASVSTGYKSGGFNTALFFNDPAFKYDEETTTNYELGMKNTFWDGRVTLNTALFYIDWRDQQVLAYDAATNATPIINAPRSRSYGFEASLAGKFDNGFRAGIGVGYADATYEEFENAFATAGGRAINANGNQQQFHSKFTGRASVGYEHELPWDKLVASIDLTFRYRSSYYYDIENRLEQDGYGTFDLSLGLGNDNYEVNLWGRNLLNQAATASKFYVPAGNAAFDQNVLVTRIDPLMVGVDFTLKF